jgi:hypothetical protein
MDLNNTMESQRRQMESTSLELRHLKSQYNGLTVILAENQDTLKSVREECFTLRMNNQVIQQLASDTITQVSRLTSDNRSLRKTSEALSISLESTLRLDDDINI